MDPSLGQKERRWYHLLAPPPVIEEDGDSAVYVPASDSRLEKVEQMDAEFKELVASSGLHLIDDFEADGRSGDLNRYAVLEKT